MHIKDMLGYKLFETLKFVRAYTDESAKSLGLTRTQWQIFATLEILEKPITQKTLLDHLEIDKAHLARVLVCLEDKGYVSRSPIPENRRTLKVKLTNEGSQMVARIRQLMLNQHNAIQTGFTEVEKELLNKMLIKIKDNLI